MLAAWQIIANYGGSQGFDTDDGSSFYQIHDNMMYAADGMKMDYGGHDSDFFRNFVVTNPYDGQNCFDVGSFKPGHGDGYYNNTCLIMGCRNPSCVDTTTSVSQCDPSIVTLKHNKYYTQHGNATIKCGRTPMSIAECHTKGMEMGSTAATLPSDVEIVAMAKDFLAQFDDK